MDSRYPPSPLMDPSTSNRNRVKNNDYHAPIPVTQNLVNLADEIKGMYCLLELISEPERNGPGEKPSFMGETFHALIQYILRVDKVIIAQDTLQRFINAISPGSYKSTTKIDFQRLDELKIQPLGIYGCKDEIVRLLLSLGAVDEKLCVICLRVVYPFSTLSLSGPDCYSRRVTLTVHSHPVYISSMLAQTDQRMNVTTSSTGPKTRPGMTVRCPLCAATG